MSICKAGLLLLLATLAPLLVAQSGVPVAGTGGGDLNATTTTQTVTFNVSGLTSSSPVEITLGIAIWHDYLGDVDVTLTAPNTNSHLIFQRLGGGSFGSAAHFGDVLGMTHRVYTFHDSATVNPYTEAGATPASVEWVPTGDLRTVDALGAVTQMNSTIDITGTQANGTWTLTFTDTYPSLDFGNVSAALTTLTVTEPVNPDMEVERATMPIADGGNDALNDVSVNGQTFTYTINNVGSGDLNLTGTPLVDVTPGTGAPTVSVTVQPATPIIPAAMTTFEIQVTPALGAFDFTVSIANNDPAKDPYDFMVTGNGFNPNLPAEASPAPSSVFTGPTNGPFTMAIDPGATLANAEIQLTDAESDDVSLLSVTETSAVAVSGIVAPTAPVGPVPTPAVVIFTGTADAANAPGSYTWEIVFEDSGSGSDVTMTVEIVINDLPPEHVIEDATGGDGSAATPYTANFTQGDDGSMSIDLASVSDPNTSQLVNLVGTTPGGSNPAGGAGLSVSLGGGFLTVTPAGTLVDADRGTHTFDVEVSDGTNSVIIALEIEVVGIAPSFTSTPVTSATPGQTYTYTATADGNPAPTLSVTSALPAWLTFNAGTGVLSGQPTKSDQNTTVNVTLEASNGVAPDATQSFTINVGSAPSSDSDSDDGGCATGSGLPTWPMLFIVAAIGAAMLLRRRTA